MTIRITGAVFLVIGCWSVGYLMTYNHKKSVQALSQLINAFEYMEYELIYRNTPLPDVLKRSGSGVFR